MLVEILKNSRLPMPLLLVAGSLMGLAYIIVFPLFMGCFIAGNVGKVAMRRLNASVAEMTHRTSVSSI